jgi:hypothetical protein
MGDRLRAGVAKLVDQPQDRGNGRLRPVPGEQSGPVLKCPGERPALPGPGHYRQHRRRHRLGIQRRVGTGDDLRDQRDGVTAAGRAPGAAGLPVPVTAVDAPQLAACRAGFPDRAADRAVPVLAAPLEGAQVLAAAGAGRRRDARRTGGAQGDEQLRDCPGCRGPPVREHARVVQQGLGQPAALGPAAGHALRRLRDHRAVQRGITPGDQADDYPDRVLQRLRADHGRRLVPGCGRELVIIRDWL